MTSTTATPSATPFDYEPFLTGTRHLIAQVLSRKPNGEELLKQVATGERLFRVLLDESAESVTIGLVDPATPEARAQVLEVVLVHGKDAGLSLAAAIDQTFGRPH